MNSLRNVTFRYKRSMALLFLLSLVTAVAVIWQAYFLVATVDSVFLKQEGLSQITWLLFGLLAMLLIRTVSTYANRRIGIHIATDVKASYRKSLLKKFADTPVNQSTGGQSGGKISILLDAVDDMDSYFSEYIPQLIQTSIIPLVILAAVLTQHFNTGLIMMITAPFIPIFMIIIGMQTKKKSEEQQEKMTTFSAHFLETLQGLTTFKLFGQVNKQQKNIETNSLSFRDATMEILKIAFVSSFMLELITMLSIGIVALELAIQLIIYERITFFTAFFLLVLTPEFYSMLKQLGSTFHNGRSSMGAAKKVTDELDKKVHPVQWGNQPLASEAMPADIQLQNVSFNYGEDLFSLDHITATIPAHAQVAIVGKSGSGKTTLLHLISGLLPLSGGDITIHDRPLTNYQEHDWFDQLSYISQNPYIFSGTIAQNIAIGSNSNVSFEAIKHAAEQAGLAEMIQKLEKGYATPVGEAGRGLSGGEKQRLALARAFLKKPALILFDEPTTGLDLYTESVLQQSVEELSRHATIITVAHRLHTIKHADSILFLENGKLTAEGTHQELLETVPAYRQMVAVQQGGAPE